MIRTWPALFAWGAGLLHVALGAAIGSGRHDAATTVLLCSMLALGIVELGWAAVALHRGRPPAPRAAGAVALAGAVLGVGVIAVGGSPFAVAAASGLALAGGVLTVRIWGPRGRRSERGDGGAGRGRGEGRRARLRAMASVAGFAMGAAIVAGIATPALATTDAGLHALPHDHGGVFDPHAGH